MLIRSIFHSSSPLLGVLLLPSLLPESHRSCRLNLNLSQVCWFTFFFSLEPNEWFCAASPFLRSKGFFHSLSSLPSPFTIREFAGLVHFLLLFFSPFPAAFFLLSGFFFSLQVPSFLSFFHSSAIQAEELLPTFLPLPLIYLDRSMTKFLLGVLPSAEKSSPLSLGSRAVSVAFRTSKIQASSVCLWR